MILAQTLQKIQQAFIIDKDITDKTWTNTTTPEWGMRLAQADPPQAEARSLIKQVWRIVKEDRCVTIPQIDNVVQLSTGLVNSILMADSCQAECVGKICSLIWPT